VYTLTEPPAPGETGLRPATLDDLDRLVPACAAAHELELGIDPLRRDADSFRWRTAAQIEDGRSWVWLERDVVLFKAEASAWTPEAVQVSQVWTDPEARRRGYALRGMRDLFRLLLETTPVVTLFVRRDNEPAIALYEKLEMQKALEYRSVLF
jgi:predicted GNAT family acetyltransferase